MLISWKHSGFNVHRSRRVESDEHDDLVRLVQYIIRNPFSVEMRGQRDKLAAEEAEKLDETAAATNIIDVSDHKPRRIPSKKWREGVIVDC